MRKVKLSGVGVDLQHAVSIITHAKRATDLTECPYRRGTHKWSIWKTTFMNKRCSHRDLLRALYNSGVKINEATR